MVASGVLGGGFESLSHHRNRRKIEQVSNIETFTNLSILKFLNLLIS